MHSSIRLTSMLFACLALRLLGAAESTSAVPASANVPADLVVTHMSRSYRADALPLGNGDIAISAWVLEGGDLLFYLAKADAYDDNQSLLKLGRIRVALTPNPFTKGQPFSERLSLLTGTLTLSAGSAADAQSVSLWVDANQPVVHIDTHAAHPVSLTITLESWREQDRELTGKEASDMVTGSGQPTIARADEFPTTPGNRIVWYHHNTHSIWPATMKLQGLTEFAATAQDPLQDRIFGGAIWGDGLVRNTPRTIASEGPRDHFHANVCALTRYPITPEQWLRALEQTATAIDAIALDKARSDHTAWWRAFWQRSWLRVTASPISLTGLVPDPHIPVHIGADSNGGSRFFGKMARARIWSHPLDAKEVAQLFSHGSQGAGPDQTKAHLVGDWQMGTLHDGTVANGVAGGADAILHGNVQPGQDGAVGYATFTGDGFFEIADSPAVAVGEGYTLELWIRLEPGHGSAGRLIDHCPAGGSNGYNFDLYPGNALRSITPTNTLQSPAHLPEGGWIQVAVSYGKGQHQLFVNGAVVADHPGDPPDDHMAQAYDCMRYLVACAGRGSPWIKFNGSLFTYYDSAAGENPDYRNWGGCQWFQNARHTYWPLLQCGDFDEMMPFFTTYRKNLEMAENRTQVYYHHAGAFFQETQTFWGSSRNVDFGWDRGNRPNYEVISGYMRTNWQGGLELSLMMLDYYAYTMDKAFLVNTALPIISAVVTFYDQHWPRESDGTLHIGPSQSLETFQISVVNPLPDVAGLQAVIQRLLELPHDLVGDAQRAAITKTLHDLPALPTHDKDGHPVLVAGLNLPGESNWENPELYAIFPYRLFGVGKPGLRLALDTWSVRHHPNAVCWGQDDIQAAFLGRAQEAGALVRRRLLEMDPHVAFPAMYSAHNDEAPDMDHGGAGMMALQTMLMQSEGDRILLFPAWPKAWDVSFKLHAPQNTTVQGTYRHGELLDLQVIPASRLHDVVQMKPQP